MSVLSWNVLAEFMAVRHRETAKLTGTWPRRMRVIVARILALRPNIVCLQEVQVRSRGCMDGSDNHAEALLDALAPFGYDGSYARVERSSTALLMWDRTLRLTSTLQPVQDIIPHSMRTEAVTAALGMYTTRLVVARMVHVATGRNVVACCGHAGVPLVRGAGGEDEYAHYIPLMDAVVSATALHSACGASMADGVAPAVVWGVDFNSRVGDPAVQFTTNGRLSGEVEARLAAQAARDGVTWFPATMGRHGVPLASAYGQVLGRELPYTNVNPETQFVGAIDYIFYSPNTLQPVAVLDVYPWSRTIHPAVPLLPNRAVPSDHLPLLATFTLDV